MSKIVQAVNKMIENSHLINPVYKSKSADTEFFFLYNAKYKWSIYLRGGGDFILYYYPSNEDDLQILASMDILTFGNVPKVMYKTEEIKTQEAIESFSELYSVCSTKIFGVDDILDDIINS